MDNTQNLVDEFKALEANVDQWSAADYARHQQLQTTLEQMGII